MIDDILEIQIHVPDKVEIEKDDTITISFRSKQNLYQIQSTAEILNLQKVDETICPECNSMIMPTKIEKDGEIITKWVCECPEEQEHGL